MQASQDFLYRYLNNPSPVGYESSGQRIWLDYLAPYVDKQFTDAYGTAVSVINPEADYRVVIEAHADEIAWYVNYISADGYMYVIPSGGSDYQIASSMHASLHTPAGVHKAVFGWPAIHVRKAGKEQELTQKAETIVLDGGFSSAEEVAAAGIHVGTVVTFDQSFGEVNDRFWVGRGLDNRMGGFMIAEVARRLHEAGKKLPFALYIVNAVQEEIGLRGAQMIAHRIQPHLALVTDVTHDTQSPLYNKKTHGDIACGKGPVLQHAAAVQRRVREMLTEVAKQHGIPYQQSAASYGTGTDTDAFAYSRHGVPSALLSLPLKYMHTTVEMVHKQDTEELIRWIYHFLLQLSPHVPLHYL